MDDRKAKKDSLLGVRFLEIGQNTFTYSFVLAMNIK